MQSASFQNVLAVARHHSENAVNRFGITERFRIINVKDAAKYSGWMNLKAGLPVRQRHHLKMFTNSLVKCGVRSNATFS
jgi:hypothetical protein